VSRYRTAPKRLIINLAHHNYDGALGSPVTLPLAAYFVFGSNPDIAGETRGRARFYYLSTTIEWIGFCVPVTVETYNLIECGLRSE